MSDPVYCTDADLYANGLPRGAVPNPGRTLAGVASGVCSLDVHGFSAGDLVSFRALGGALPSPLVEGVTYFANPLTEASFAVRAVDVGPDLTVADNAQDPAIVVFTPLAAIFAAARAWASRIVDDMLPAHVAPIPDPVPEIIRMTTSELAVGKVLQQQGAASKSLSDIVASAQKRLERWATGVPLRGADAPTPALLAVAGAVSRDARGWRQFGGF